MQNWQEGIFYFIDMFDDKTLVDLLEDVRFTPFIENVTDRALKTPSILNYINLERNGGFKLWLMQFEKGGEFHPSSISKSTFCENLSPFLERISSIETFKKISIKISDFVLALTDRDLIWSQLKPKHSTILAKELVSAMLRNNSNINNLNSNDHYFIDEFNLYFDDSDQIKASLLISYLTKNNPCNENEILRWLNKVPSVQWTLYAQELGVIVLKNRWSRIANEICNSSFSRWPKTPQLKIAVKIFLELLNYSNRWTYIFSDNKNKLLNKNELIQYLSEICEDIAHDRLEYFWKKAGGKACKLQQNGTSSEQWLHAATEAENGMLKDGLKSLIKVLIDDYPNNTDLQKIQELEFPYK